MSFRISSAASEGRWGPLKADGVRWVNAFFTPQQRLAHAERRGLDSWRSWGLTPRLAEVASLVPLEMGVVDVGTDHALLPLALTRRGYCPHALGVDVNERPLRGARARLSSEDKVTLVLADGFLGSATEGERLWAKLGAPPEGLCGCVCGVGGAKIAEMIPTLPPWVHRLVLQPNLHHERVRSALWASGWWLTEERLTVEGDRVFLTLAAQRKPADLSHDFELSQGDHERLISREAWYPMWLWVHLEKELSLISRAVEHSSEQARRHFDERRARASELEKRLRATLTSLEL